MWVQVLFAAAVTVLDAVVAGNTTERVVVIGRALSVFLLVASHEAAMLAVAPAAFVLAAAGVTAATRSAQRFATALLAAAAVYAALVGTFQMAHGNQSPAVGALAVVGATGFAAVFRAKAEE
jgi:hypothetical protein